ncbi:MAG: hypothetical protein DMF51_17450 [Acidobacteria bacterium]|nr:MAG: hypothetical protein DMF51_17450 [Acidobacteriota bacterium]
MGVHPEEEIITMVKMRVTVLVVSLVFGSLAASQPVVATPQDACPTINCTDVVNVLYDPFSTYGNNFKTLYWTTVSETNLAGFNILIFDRGSRTFSQLNGSLIPCEFCTTGGSGAYQYIAIPKNASCVYVQVVYQSASAETCGPALKR